MLAVGLNCFVAVRNKIDREARFLQNQFAYPLIDCIIFSHQDAQWRSGCASCFRCVQDS